MTLSQTDTFSDLAVQTRTLRDAVQVELSRDASAARWQLHYRRFRRQTGSAGRLAFADAVAQAVTCAAFGWHSFAGRLPPASVEWLVASADPLVADVLRWSHGPSLAPTLAPAVREAIQRVVGLLENNIESLSRQLPASSHLADAAVYFYERFLARYDPAARRGKGVFYTPHELVAFMVRTVDQMLVDEFALPHGLADTAPLRGQDMSADRAAPASTGFGTPRLRILDPAMGTGAFLLEVLARTAARFRHHATADSTRQTDTSQRWNDYVVSHLLPRLWGQEIMLPPLVLAHLAVSAWLSDSGFRFDRPGKLHLYLANSLASPQVGHETSRSASEPFTIVLGNPPFSGVSDNRQTWIRDLLRGRSPDPPHEVANYFLAQGHPLRERKHWLEDDYVKFLRLAHWQIERADTGIVALITNHGYLENTTFRGMREQLLATFPLVDVVDLHGNSRNGDRTPEGGVDESLFGIEQGVAASFLRRPPRASAVPRLRRIDLWGTRSIKLHTLADHSAQTLPHTAVSPQPPLYFFAQRISRPQPEYDGGFRLCDVMPTHSTAAVTARDGFVVAFDADELCARIEQFVDPQISDTQIRRRFFGNGRSRKYPAGDTRGWQLAEARRRLMRQPDWRDSLRSCLYRPFDRRQILWLPWMIDWPRREIMDHLTVGGNLALIARRQLPPAAPCDYFWVTDTITLDGVVRSDNRGSESVFPLFLLDPSRPAEANRTTVRSATSRANFCESFIQYCTRRLQLEWSPDTSTDLPRHGNWQQLTPAALFYFIYGLFHCPSYRQRFAERLRIDFPRVIVPRHVSLFRQVALSGQRLARTHLLAADRHADPQSDDLRAGNPGCRSWESTDGNTTVEPGYPKYAQRAVWLNASSRFSPVSRRVWQFRVGTYQVCRKWLGDRRGRTLTAAQLQHYHEILSAIDATLRATERLEHLLESHGGWQMAF